MSIFHMIGTAHTRAGPADASSVVEMRTVREGRQVGRQAGTTGERNGGRKGARQEGREGGRERGTEGGRERDPLKCVLYVCMHILTHACMDARASLQQRARECKRHGTEGGSLVQFHDLD
jgi:hypothetical protein